MTVERQAAPEAAAVLWDLDNVDPGPAATRALAAALRRMSGYCAPLLVSGHPHRIQRSTRVLRSEGFAILAVQGRPDAADRRLLEAGRRLHRHGTDLFIVVSGDHAFAPLAMETTVVVLALDLRTVSNLLTRYALAVLPVDLELARAAMTFTEK